MKQKLTPRETLAVASLLFGLFFGAGNLIFPVHMGQAAGTHTVAATLGFVITGVGLPLLGVAAMGLSRSESLAGLAGQVGKGYGLFFTVLLYLTIGPCFAIPRCATTSFTVGVVPLLSGGSEKMWLLGFSLVFFLLVLCFSLRPSGILTWVGRIINPVFLIFLFSLIIASALHPMASISQVSPEGSYAVQPFLQGFLEGYNTMDTLAALAFGITIVQVIRQLGVEQPADLMAAQIDISAEGTTFDLLWQGRSYPLRLHTPGRFSVYNALGTAGACLMLGIPMEEILAGLAENPGISGRFQTVRSKKGCQAVIDYAHTPDGLENVLATAREFAKGRIIAVFGCGGDRDRTKRPIMGEIGGRLADYCIITSDNPRTEEPLAILADVEEGVKRTDCPYEKTVDRREAIQRAAAMAGQGDVILIAGKGHETYQIFANETIHFDDMEEIRKAFGEDLL